MDAMDNYESKFDIFLAHPSSPSLSRPSQIRPDAIFCILYTVSKSFCEGVNFGTGKRNLVTCMGWE
jgi:hypothetical protein